MAWSSVGNFAVLIGAGVRTHTLAVYDDELYMGTLDNPTFKGQVWKCSDGTHSWSFVHQFENDILHLYSFGTKLYALVRFETTSGIANGIWSYNGTSWTLEYEYVPGVVDTSTIGNFVENDGDLYALYANIVFVENAGSWSIIDDTTDSPNKRAIGSYGGNLYLSGRVGTLLSGTNYVRLYVPGSGFITDVFTEASGGSPISNRHYQARGIVEYGANAYFIETRYIHEYDGVSTSLSNTFNYDVNSSTGFCDGYVFNGKLWASHIFDSGLSLSGGTYTYDGVSWSLNSTLSFYSNTNIGGNYAPPVGFIKWNQGSGSTYYLYVCAGPGQVWVNTETEAQIPSYVRGQGIAASKGTDDRLYVTVWRGDTTEQYIRVYDGPTLIGERETSLGSALSVSIDNGVKAAWPYAVDGLDGTCIVYGNFIYALDVRHIIYSINAATTFSIVEDGWGNDVCGALVMRGNAVYAVRNKANVGYLYVGTVGGGMSYVSTIDFPVGHNNLALSRDNQYLLALNKTANNVPRVMLAKYPFKIWKDISYNFPYTGVGTSIVSLR